MENPETLTREKGPPSKREQDHLEV